MNDGVAVMAVADQGKTRRARLILLLVFAFFVLPFATAWVLNFSADFTPEATTNHGTLISPVQPVRASGLVDIAGAALADDLLKGKWTLVYRLAGDCDDACHQALYVLRQVRLAQGKNIDRVQRLLVLDAPATPDWAAEVQSHYPGLLLARPGAAEAVDQFPAPNRIFLVDPLGNLMMEYALDTEPRGMVKDLERLLRISYVG